MGAVTVRESRYDYSVGIEGVDKTWSGQVHSIFHVYLGFTLEL
jgi:hypothetical protein